MEKVRNAVKAILRGFVREEKQAELEVPAWETPDDLIGMCCDKCGKPIADNGYTCPSCGDLLCPACAERLNEYGECPACDEYEGSARG